MIIINIATFKIINYIYEYSRKRIAAMDRRKFPYL